MALVLALGGVVQEDKPDPRLFRYPELTGEARFFAESRDSYKRKAEKAEKALHEALENLKKQGIVIGDLKDEVNREQYIHDCNPETGSPICNVCGEDTRFENLVRDTMCLHCYELAKKGDRKKLNEYARAVADAVLRADDAEARLQYVEVMNRALVERVKYLEEELDPEDPS